MMWEIDQTKKRLGSSGSRRCECKPVWRERRILALCEIVLAWVRGCIHSILAGVLLRAPLCTDIVPTGLVSPISTLVFLTNSRFGSHLTTSAVPCGNMSSSEPRTPLISLEQMLFDSAQHKTVGTMRYEFFRKVSDQRLVWNNVPDMINASGTFDTRSDKLGRNAILLL